jgi:hypothetical protein
VSTNISKIVTINLLLTDPATMQQLVPYLSVVAESTNKMKEKIIALNIHIDPASVSINALMEQMKQPYLRSITDYAINIPEYTLICGMVY